MSDEIRREEGSSEPLESWKEIASYVHKDVRTCQRWEKDLNFPVHRINSQTNSRVFALKNEIDRWINTETVREGLESESSPIHRLQKRWTIVAVCSFIGIVAALLFFRATKNENSLNKLIKDFPITSTGSKKKLIDTAWSGKYFGIVWEETGTEDPGIFFQSLSMSSLTAFSPIRLSEKKQHFSGEANITWNDDENKFALIYQAGYPAELYFNRVDESGTVAGSPVQVTHDLFDNGSPKIVWTGTGYALVWFDYGRSVMFAWLGSDGKTKSSAKKIVDGNDPRYPSLAWNPINKEFALAWNALPDGQRDIFFAILDANGDPKRTNRISLNYGWKDWPSISWNGKEYALVWNDSSSGYQEVFFARIDPSGNILPPGPVQITQQKRFCHRPQIAWSGREFGIIYQMDLSETSGTIGFARIDATGKKIEGDLIFPVMTENNITPRIIWANGFFEIIWERKQKEISEFFFNRIGRGNLPPVAICKKNIIKKADRNGWAKIIPQEIDAGSFDPNGGNIILTLDNINSLPAGMNTVTLIVKNSKGQRDFCVATVIVQK